MGGKYVTYLFEFVRSWTAMVHSSFLKDFLIENYVRSCVIHNRKLVRDNDNCVIMTTGNPDDVGMFPEELWAKNTCIVWTWPCYNHTSLLNFQSVGSCVEAVAALSGCIWLDKLTIKRCSTVLCFLFNQLYMNFCQVAVKWCGVVNLFMHQVVNWLPLAWVCVWSLLCCAFNESLTHTHTVWVTVSESWVDQVVWPSLPGSTKYHTQVDAWCLWS